MRCNHGILIALLFFLVGLFPTCKPYEKRLVGEWANGRDDGKSSYTALKLYPDGTFSYYSIDRKLMVSGGGPYWMRCSGTWKISDDYIMLRCQSMDGAWGPETRDLDTGDQKMAYKVMQIEQENITLSRDGKTQRFNRLQ